MTSLICRPTCFHVHISMRRNVWKWNSTLYLLHKLRPVVSNSLPSWSQRHQQNTMARAGRFVLTSLLSESPARKLSGDLLFGHFLKSFSRFDYSHTIPGHFSLYLFGVAPSDSISVWTMVHSTPLSSLLSSINSDYPANIKHLYNIIYNDEPTSTLYKYCTNVCCLLGNYKMDEF